MLQEFKTRLEKNIEQRRRKGKLEQDLIAVKKELQEKSARLESLSIQLDKEKVDVEKLERTSLTTLFYTVLGSREQQLEKERQELLSAQLLYQQSSHQVDFLERDRDSIIQELERLKGVDQEYELLLSEKEQYLRQTSPAVAGELVDLSEQIAVLKSEIKEVTEAIAAGKDAISGLEGVIDSLGSAENWGTWDMLGGGFLSTAIKHSRIDDARRGIQEVQVKMSQFKREMADVQKSVDLQINIGEFESFADYFMDSLIMDWIVQSKIVDSLDRCKQAKTKITGAVKELVDLRQGIQSQASHLESKRTRLIEGT